MAPKRVTIDLDETERFFWDNAGYSHKPDETIRSGHAKSAVSLAIAERHLKNSSDVSVRWESDDVPWECGCDQENCEPEYVMIALIVRDQGDPDNPDIIGSLGGIGLNSLDDPYMRVIEAELADEYL